MKKVLSIVLAISMLLALAVPAFAANDKKIVAMEYTAKSEFNNAQFHCNDIVGENGRVWTLDSNKLKPGGNNSVKNTGELIFNRIGNTTTWELDVETTDGAYICEQCGRNDWITFSNNSGLPDGKNVQVQHNGPSKFWLTINKTWKDGKDGNIIDKPAIFGDDIPLFDVKFDDGDTDYVNEVDKDGTVIRPLKGVGVGKYLVPIMKDAYDNEINYKVIELPITGYTPVEPYIIVNKSNRTIMFINEADPVIEVADPIVTVIKTWEDKKGINNIDSYVTINDNDEDNDEPYILGDPYVVKLGEIIFTETVAHISGYTSECIKIEVLGFDLDTNEIDVEYDDDLINGSVKFTAEEDMTYLIIFTNKLIEIPPTDECEGLYIKGSETVEGSNIFNTGNHDTIYFDIERKQDGIILDRGHYWFNHVDAPTNDNHPWTFKVYGEYGYWDVELVIFSRNSSQGTFSFDVEVDSIKITYIPN